MNVIGNTKFYENDHQERSQNRPKLKEKGETLSLKAKKESSDEEHSTSVSEDEEYIMAVRDIKKLFKRRGRLEFLGVIAVKKMMTMNLKRNVTHSSSANKSKYIKEMLKKFGLEDSKLMKTSMSSDTKLMKDEEYESVDRTKYRGMIGQVPVNVAKQSSPRAAASISTVRPVNTAAPKSKVNGALPTTYSYYKAHSPVRRAFNQKSAAKTNHFNEKVNTVWVNNVTTAAIVSAAEGNRENADQGIFDSGCSRHMTGNKSFFNDYQEINGGFVTFRGSPKVEENLHITFLENKPNVAGSGPNCLFDIVNQRKKLFAQQRAKAKRNKPMTPAQQKDYMSNYIKNQEGGYSIKGLKSLSFEQVKEIFETTIKKVQSFVPIRSELEVQRLKRAEPRQALQEDTQFPQTSVPIPHVADEAIFKEWDDRVVRATTTAASLDAAQASGNISKTQSMAMSNDPLSQEIGLGDRPRCQEAMEGVIAQTRSERASKHSYDSPLPPTPPRRKHTIKKIRKEMHKMNLTDFVPPTPHDSPISGGHMPGSDEGRPNINELMAICTNLSNRVLALEQSKTAQDLVIRKLKKKVKKLEKKLRARTPGMKLSSIVPPEKRSFG
ncbi:hypothetical protein Tco_0034017 [Tanacetum coccineum]